MDAKTLGAQPITPMSPELDRSTCTPGGQWGERGLTKRERFAMAAMQGLTQGFYAEGHDVLTRELARDAVEMADALLEALTAGEQP